MIDEDNHINASLFEKERENEANYDIFFLYVFNADKTKVNAH